MSDDKLSKMLDIDTMSDENIQNLIKELTTDNNLETKTDLNPNQIITIARALWFANRYRMSGKTNVNNPKIKDLSTLDDFVRFVLKLLISKGRMGRKEVVEALTGAFKFNIAKAQTKEVEM